MPPTALLRLGLVVCLCLVVVGFVEAQIFELNIETKFRDCGGPPSNPKVYRPARDFQCNYDSVINSVYWGNNKDGKSGVRFTPSIVRAKSQHQVLLGELTHFNNVVQTSELSRDCPGSVYLELNITGKVYDDRNTLITTLQFSPQFLLLIHETPNSASTLYFNKCRYTNTTNPTWKRGEPCCPYPTKQNACSDLLVFQESSKEDQVTFQSLGVEYRLQLSGFRTGEGAESGAPVQNFYSEENQNSSAKLVGRIVALCDGAPCATLVGERLTNPAANVLVAFGVSEENPDNAVPDHSVVPVVVKKKQQQEDAKTEIVLKEDKATTVQFVEMREVDTEDKVVRTYSLLEQAYQLSSYPLNDPPSVTFLTALTAPTGNPVTKPTLSFDFKLFAEEAVLDNDVDSAANKTLQVDANTCKWTFVVQRWPFASVNNFLELRLRVLSKDRGGFLQVNTRQQETQDEVTFLLNTRNTLATLSFLTYGLKEVSKIRTEAEVSWSKEEVGEGEEEEEEGALSFILRFKAFQTSLLYDPMLSVALGKTEEEDGGEGMKDLYWQIAVGLVGGIFLLVAMVVLAVFLYRKHQRVKWRRTESNLTVNF